VLKKTSAPRIFAVPLFISEGYFTDEAIPRELGLAPGNSALRTPHSAFFYTRPIGTHASMTDVILARAREVAETFPFPRAPKPKDAALFIAGHGTELNENSRKAIERQVEIIRAQNLYADVHALFIEEEPRIAKCYEMSPAKNFVIIPFFISDGLHVDEDIPVLLGEPERIVRQRLAEGKPTWRNPTERNGKLVWYSRAVGTQPHVAEVILERVREAD
jgi:sirohydrochlorin cobaltochelatase